CTATVPDISVVTLPPVPKVGSSVTLLWALTSAGESTITKANSACVRLVKFCVVILLFKCPTATGITSETFLTLILHCFDFENSIDTGSAHFDQPGVMPMYPKCRTPEVTYQ